MIENYIKQHAELMPEKAAVICDNEYVDYAHLWQQVKAQADLLRQQGVKPGSVVVMRTSQTIGFLIDYFAVHIAGAVAMPLDHNIPQERFESIRQQYEGKPMPDGVADILFTTGTTGLSKGVMISHDTIMADAENLVDAHGYTRQTVFVVCGPLNHIGSLSKVYPVVMQGATLIIVDGMRDFDAFFRAMEYPSDKMATFLVPANVRMLLMLAKKRLKPLAAKIDFIESGAAHLMHSDMKALCELLPRTRLFNTYASTETGIIATYNYNDGQCLPGCLGRTMKHAGIRISDDGLIVCSGRTLMTGYADDQQLTDTILRDGELYTSDLGRIDEQGMLHLMGREDDVINVGGLKVAPLEVEDVAMEMPEVEDCICVEAPHPISGSSLKLIVVLKEGATLDRKKMAMFINKYLETYKVPLTYEQTDQIRRTFNGKPDRKYYRMER